MKTIRVTFRLPNEPESTIDLPYGQGTLEDLQLQIQLTINSSISVIGTSEENWHRQHASLIEIIKQEVITQT